MLLNIEQYEYMTGPNEGAGVRILLHDQQEAPPVKDVSMSIPPGAHALVVGEIVLVGLMKNWVYDIVGTIKTKNNTNLSDDRTVLGCSRTNLSVR